MKHEKHNKHAAARYRGTVEDDERVTRKLKERRRDAARREARARQDFARASALRG